METTENATTQDPLGLKRFALTESAYDLVNSIRGTYGRLNYAESQKASPDQELIHYWRNQSKKVGRAYRSLNDGDLNAIDQFIKAATIEWNQVTKLESERALTLSHVS